MILRFFEELTPVECEMNFATNYFGLVLLVVLTGFESPRSQTAKKWRVSYNSKNELRFDNQGPQTSTSRQTCR